MNSFGRLFSIQIFGESHGNGVGITINGCPAGISLHKQDFTVDLERRKGGQQKGTTLRKEEDIPNILSGCFKGKSTGAPICLFFENKNFDSSPYNQNLIIPRPGHADFVAFKKFKGFNDFRGGGHFSGRLTLPLTAAGVVAKKIISQINSTIKINSTILEIGGFKNLNTGLKKAITANDSIGGIVECRVKNLPIGLGDPFFDSVESLISHMVFSIPAMRGIEFGEGFKAAKMFGSLHNDAIKNLQGKTKTNHSGGISGGLTNGNEFVFRVAVKPASSTPKKQNSIQLDSGKMKNISIQGKHDLCIALRVPVILEAITAIVFADLLLLPS